jgi:hypothetical protein
MSGCRLSCHCSARRQRNQRNLIGQIVEDGRLWRFRRQRWHRKRIVAERAFHRLPGILLCNRKHLLAVGTEQIHEVSYLSLPMARA